jgi:hypothetical protein
MVKSRSLAGCRLSWWGVSLAIRLAADEGISSFGPLLQPHSHISKKKKFRAQSICFKKNNSFSFKRGANNVSEISLCHRGQTRGRFISNAMLRICRLMTSMVAQTVVYILGAYIDFIISIRVSILLTILFLINLSVLS